MTTKAEIIFYGGHIFTMDEAKPCEGQTTMSPMAEAVAVAKGTILAVGTMKTVFTLAGDNTSVIFLNGRTLMPGLIECHQHATMCAMKNVIFTDISAMKYRYVFLLTFLVESGIFSRDSTCCWAVGSEKIQNLQSPLSIDYSNDMRKGDRGKVPPVPMESCLHPVESGTRDVKSVELVMYI